MTPTFLAVGHFCYDITPKGYVLGGSAAYSTITARNLGCRPRVITAVGNDFNRQNPLLNGIEVIYQESSNTTIFENRYSEDGQRQQSILALVAKLIPQHITGDCREAEVVYLCPIADEVEPECIRCFKGSLIGVTPQGWMRHRKSNSRVLAKHWSSAALILPHADVLILSDEDLSTYPDQLEKYIELTKIVVLTKGKHGAALFENGRVLNSNAYPANEIDPTGAGDVFAAAFLIKYYETQSPQVALNFAHCAASFAVEGRYTANIPTLDSIRSRLKPIGSE
ncbi:MAG: PfkB family carbohydrate kinase [Candidatus Poribacteria bacterium]|nr:PfkB family carbohydrate kinase [Candidatus Poribacteria bacterium]